MTNNKGAPRAARSTDDGPWAWFSKAAMRKINEAFGESGQVVSARVYYGVLCEMASDHQSQTFNVSRAAIAYRSGLSAKWVGMMADRFHELGLIAVRKRKDERGMDLPSEYTLLTVGSEFPPDGSERLQHSVPTLEESPEESERKVMSAPTGADTRGNVTKEASKEEQLERISLPDDFPTEAEYAEFVEAECETLMTLLGQDGRYAELLAAKGHVWKNNRWEKIHDWKRFTAGLDAAMHRQKTKDKRNKPQKQAQRTRLPGDSGLPDPEGWREWLKALPIPHPYTRFAIAPMELKERWKERK